MVSGGPPDPAAGPEPAVTVSSDGAGAPPGSWAPATWPSSTGQKCAAVWSSSSTGSPRMLTQTSACQTSSTLAAVAGGKAALTSRAVALRVPNRKRRRLW